MTCDPQTSAACFQYHTPTPTPTPTWWPTPTPTPVQELAMTGMNVVLMIIIGLCLVGLAIAGFRAARNMRT